LTPSDATTGDKLRVTVLGAGSWGTALAHLLAGRGHDVMMWAFEPEVVTGINERHVNPLYMKDTPLPHNLRASGSFAEALAGAQMVLFTIPAQRTRVLLRDIKPHLPHAPLVICSKGIERGTLATLDQVFHEELPAELHRFVAVLSGPSFAAEVIANQPTNVTLACRDRDVAKTAQAAIATRAFRVYTTDDVIGVEIGGALKNIMAIVVGATDELGLGNNTRAALITRGLAEITRIAIKLGARPETLLGLSGVGDLVLTCTGDLSRNRMVGKLLARGHNMEQVRAEMRNLAEGVETAESAYQLAKRLDVDIPIIDVVYQVIYEGKGVIDAMQALQGRSLKDEWRV
jgi:glycerol-3-phosphate dehydrogenase (NAD(P)+)